MSVAGRNQCMATVSIYIRNSQRQALRLRVPPQTSVKFIQQHVDSKLRIPISSQHLFLNGLPLDSSIPRLKTQQNMIIHVVDGRKLFKQSLKLRVRRIEPGSPIYHLTVQSAMKVQYLMEQLHKHYEDVDNLFLVSMGRELMPNRSLKQQLLEDGSQVLVIHKIQNVRGYVPCNPPGRSDAAKLPIFKELNSSSSRQMQAKEFDCEADTKGAHKEAVVAVNNKQISAESHRKQSTDKIVDQSKQLISNLSKGQSIGKQNHQSPFPQSQLEQRQQTQKIPQSNDSEQTSNLGIDFQDIQYRLGGREEPVSPLSQHTDENWIDLSTRRGPAVTGHQPELLKEKIVAVQEDHKRQHQAMPTSGAHAQLADEEEMLLESSEFRQQHIETKSDAASSSIPPKMHPQLLMSQNFGLEESSDDDFELKGPNKQHQSANGDLIHLLNRPQMQGHLLDDSEHLKPHKSPKQLLTGKNGEKGSFQGSSSRRRHNSDSWYRMSFSFRNDQPTVVFKPADLIVMSIDARRESGSASECHLKGCIKQLQEGIFQSFEQALSIV